MNRTKRASRTIRTSAATAGVAALVAAAGVSLAPPASADGAATPADVVSLSTSTPHELGLAGQPVEFTDTVTGGKDAKASDGLKLVFHIDGGMGLPENALSLAYRADGGSWKPVPMKASYNDKEGTVFDGTVPQSLHLAAGQTRAFHLRLGLPMGSPHDGDSNGGTESLKVFTAVAYEGGGASVASKQDVVAVDGLASSLSGLPKSVTAGGAPVAFEATVRNPTASSYINLDHMLFINRYATVQVLRGGRWTTVPPRTSIAEPDYGFTLDGKDSSLAAHAATTTKVRVSYRKGAPAGPTTIVECVIVNEGTNFRGSTMCGASAKLTIKPAATGTTGGNGGGTPSPGPTATASPTAGGTTASGGTTSGTGGTSAQLAHTGSGSTTPMLAGAGALLLAGAGALTIGARRRTAARRGA